MTISVSGRYDIRLNDDGSNFWTVYDIRTGQTAIWNGVILDVCGRDEASELASLLNSLYGGERVLPNGAANFDLELDIIANLIAELVRSANAIERLTEAERAGLLEKAYTTLQGIRVRANLRRPSSGRDLVWDLLTISRMVVIFSDAEIQRAMLDAVGMLRSFRIILKGGQAAA